MVPVTIPAQLSVVIGAVTLAEHSPVTVAMTGTAGAVKSGKVPIVTFVLFEHSISSKAVIVYVWAIRLLNVPLGNWVPTTGLIE